MTFKGLAMGDAPGSQTFDLKVLPREQVAPFLKALGFEQVLLFEKDRESWEIEGCKVELDTLPEFGTFVEIEGPSEEEVRAVQGRLGLGDLGAGAGEGTAKWWGEHLGGKAGGRSRPAVSGMVSQESE